MEQSWVGKFFIKNCEDPVIAPIRIRCLRVRKTSWTKEEIMSIRQQIIATKAYKEQEVQENIDETNCRVC